MPREGRLFTEGYREMKSRAVSGIILTLLLIGMLTLAFYIQPVRASGTIYIKADGSIEGTTDIMTVDNVTYTFTNNISDSIVVERDNIVVDGAGYTLQGTVASFSKGLDLSNRNNVTIKNMKIKTFFFGIYLDLSLNNTILGNTIVNNQYGMFLYSSSNFNTIQGNTITNYYFWTGIVLNDSSNNTISGNYITYNEYGITIYDSSNYNTISGNNITNNIRGINLYESSNNKFYHNNFLGNIKHVYIYPYVHANFWDDGVEGNYWSDYAGDDSDNNGVGDSVYPIDGNNTDHYPLMGMFYGFSVFETYYVNVISNSSVSNFEWGVGLPPPPEIFLSFYVAGSDGSLGFCRIMIPRGLMNDTYRVFVSNKEVPYTLLPCSNIAHSYLYFTYNLSTQEVIIIPEFPSFLILPLFMITTLLAVIVYRRKHST